MARVNLNASCPNSINKDQYNNMLACTCMLSQQRNLGTDCKSAQ